MEDGSRRVGGGMMGCVLGSGVKVERGCGSGTGSLGREAKIGVLVVWES